LRLALVVPTWSLAAARRGELREGGVWVAGLAFPILVSHQSEEWVWPGGFLPFCNTRLLGSDRPDWPLTERDGFHVNVTAGWLSAVAGLALWRRTPVVAGGVLVMEAGSAHARCHGNAGASLQPRRRYGHRADGSPRRGRGALAGALRAIIASARASCRRHRRRFYRTTAGDEDADASRVAAIAWRVTPALLLSRGCGTLGKRSDLYSRAIGA
jgi:hypothetical protein